MVRVLTGNLQRVLRLQKRSARAILDADTLANSVELFVKLNWLPLHLEVKVNICIQNYKRVNGHSPSYMHIKIKLASTSPRGESKHLYSKLQAC